MGSLIQVNNLSRYFNQTHALAGVTFSLESQNEYAIVGASGCGKSTLLHLLGGLDRPTDGEVLFNGANIFSMNDEELALYRNQSVGFVFQFHYLLPAMTVMENILLPARLGKGELKGKIEYAKRLASELGVFKKLDFYPHELSGGEQQRAAVVRSLLQNPSIILCDEPTGNLDSENGQSVITLLRKEAKEIGALLVVVTHDKELARSFSHLITMKDGKII